jgi:hypothetical protein
MKLSVIFNLVTDGQDVLDLFHGVNNVDQLRGRLRRLSQIEADDLLTCLDGLRTSISATLNATLEMNADIGDPEDELEEESPDLPGIDSELGDLGDEEDQSPDGSTPTEKINS